MKRTPRNAIIDPTTVRLSGERWLPVTGYEDRYDVSTHGRVRSWYSRWGRRDEPTLRKPTVNPTHNYLQLTLVGEAGVAHTYSVHRLVLLAFVGPSPVGYESLHKNGNKQDARLRNLRYGTKLENAKDKHKHGTTAKGSNHGHAVLTEVDIPRIRRLVKEMSLAEVAAIYGVSKTTISDIRKGKIWAHV